MLFSSIIALTWGEWTVMSAPTESASTPEYSLASINNINFKPLRKKTYMSIALFSLRIEFELQSDLADYTFLS